MLIKNGKYISKISILFVTAGLFQVPRHEHIHFLEMLIKKFSGLHGCLTNLKELTTNDPETDFFQNIKLRGV